MMYYCTQIVRHTRRMAVRAICIMYTSRGLLQYHVAMRPMPRERMEKQLFLLVRAAGTAWSALRKVRHATWCDV